jgi:hypothetical protein
MEKRYETDAERQRAYRERQREQEELAAELEEQAIRDFYGYSASETRTKAERDQAARRMLGKEESWPSAAG